MINVLLQNIREDDQLKIIIKGSYLTFELITFDEQTETSEKYSELLKYGDKRDFRLEIIGFASLDSKIYKQIMKNNIDQIMFEDVEEKLEITCVNRNGVTDKHIIQSSDYCTEYIDESTKIKIPYVSAKYLRYLNSIIGIHSKIKFVK